MRQESIKEFLKIKELVEEFYNCEDGLSHEDNYDLRDIMSIIDNMYNRATNNE